MNDTDTPKVLRRHTFTPDADPLPELKKHLTAQQLYQISQAIEFVKGQTGHGAVTIEIRKDKPRFISVTFGSELDP